MLESLRGKHPIIEDILEYRKLTNRLGRINLSYNEENLARLGQLITRGMEQAKDRQEALGCLGGLFL